MAENVDKASVKSKHLSQKELRRRIQKGLDDIGRMVRHHADLIDDVGDLTEAGRGVEQIRVGAERVMHYVQELKRSSKDEAELLCQAVDFGVAHLYELIGLVEMRAGLV